LGMTHHLAVVLLIQLAWLSAGWGVTLLGHRAKNLRDFADEASKAVPGADAIRAAHPGAFSALLARYIVLNVALWLTVVDDWQDFGVFGSANQGQHYLASGTEQGPVVCSGEV